MLMTIMAESVELLIIIALGVIGTFLQLLNG